MHIYIYIYIYTYIYAVVADVELGLVRDDMHTV